MNLNELCDETIAVAAALDALGAVVAVDRDRGVHLFTPPEVGDLGALTPRLPGVVAALAAVSEAERVVREASHA